MPYFKLLISAFFIVSCSSATNSSTDQNLETQENSTPSFKRAAPKKVPPIVLGDMKYSATMNEIVATDTLTKNILWIKEIYAIDYDESLERDVQDVFITSITASQDSMIITNEDGEMYTLNLETQKVTR